MVCLWVVMRRVCLWVVKRRFVCEWWWDGLFLNGEGMICLRAAGRWFVCEWWRYGSLWVVIAWFVLELEGDGLFVSGEEMFSFLIVRILSTLQSVHDLFHVHGALWLVCNLRHYDWSGLRCVCVWGHIKSLLFSEYWAQLFYGLYDDEHYSKTSQSGIGQNSPLREVVSKKS